MIITKTNSIPNIQWQDMELLEMVSGSAIQLKQECKKRTAQSVVYDSISAVNEALELAVERMTEKAEKLSASAVIKAEYFIIPLSSGDVVITVYGMAVKFNKSEKTETAEESYLFYGKLDFSNKPESVDIFPEQNSVDKNILNINSAHEEILKKSIKEIDVKSLLKKIDNISGDLKFELCRVYSNKENIDYIFDEIAELSVLFGQLALLETAALMNLKTVIDKKINEKNTLLTHAERKKYYED